MDLRQSVIAGLAEHLLDEPRALRKVLCSQFTQNTSVHSQKSTNNVVMKWSEACRTVYAWMLTLAPKPAMLFLAQAKQQGGKDNGRVCNASQFSSFRNTKQTSKGTTRLESNSLHAMNTLETSAAVPRLIVVVNHADHSVCGGGSGLQSNE